MSNKDWTERLRNRLENHQVAPPDDLWAGIEAGLEAKQGGRRATVVGLRRWGVAAAVALLGVLGWQLLDNNATETVAVHQPAMQTGQPPATESTAFKGEEAPADRVDAAAPTSAQRASSLLAVARNVRLADDLHPSEYAEAATDVEENENFVTSAETGESMDEPQGAPQKKVDVVETKVTEPMGGYEVGGEWPHNKRQRRTVELALYGSNGLAESQNASAVRMTDALANTYYSAVETVRRGAPMPAVYMAGYEEREHHRQPFSVGLSAGVPMGERWTLSAGLVYTQLHADFVKILADRRMTRKQDLQYLGIPVNINYRFAQTKRLKAYATAGMQADVNVKAKAVSEGVETEMKKDRPQFSTQAAVGLQFDVMPQVGVYVEPGMKYYFDNGSNVSTFFKDKPCSFNLQVGLRWNFK